MNMTILFRLIVAHILADFALQPDKICKGKSINGCKGFGFLLLHSSIHATLAYLLLAQWTNWLIPIVIFLTHLGMDWLKAKKMKPNTRAFLLDQTVHIAIILILWLVFFADLSTLWISTYWQTPSIWIIAMSYLLVLQPTSLLLGMFIAKWTPQEMKDKSLPNAGKWIGYLERVLILSFVLIGSMESVGFLLAAKSIFRFGELNKAQEIRTTEYVLIGTLASFTMAILIGLITKTLCQL